MLSPKILLTSLLLAIVMHLATALPAINDGKYNPKQYGNSGKYAHDDSGKYVNDVDKYKYVHIDNPYLHIDNPYLHDAPTPVPYDHENDKYGYYQELDSYGYAQEQDKYGYAQEFDKNKHEDSKSASTNIEDPFKNNYFVITKPKIIREYGPPLFDPTNNVEARSSSKTKREDSVAAKKEEKPKQ